MTEPTLETPRASTPVGHDLERDPVVVGIFRKGK
jgi:hypothetical protein